MSQVNHAWNNLHFHLIVPLYRCSIINHFNRNRNRNRDQRKSRRLFIIEDKKMPSNKLKTETFILKAIRVTILNSSTIVT